VQPEKEVTRVLIYSSTTTSDIKKDVSLDFRLFLFFLFGPPPPPLPGRTCSALLFSDVVEQKIQEIIRKTWCLC
jgi:hypothetical protein